MSSTSMAATALIGLALLATACAEDGAGTTTTAATSTTTTAAAIPTTTVTDDPAPATTSTVRQARTVLVDWRVAASTSAEGLDVEVAPLRLTFLVPSPMWNVYEEGWAVTAPSTGSPRTGITFERPLAIYADRCAWDDPDGLIVIGPTVDDLVDALVANPEYAATNVRDVVVDGFSGKELDMIGTPPDFDPARCSRGFHRPWAGRFGMGSSEMNRLRIFDVGGERVVMRALWHPGTSAQDLDILWSIFESLRIEILP
jgi:hypothetical protein